MNQFGKAAETLHKVTTSHPYDISAHLLEGDTLLAIDRGYEALECYQAALKLDPLNGLSVM